jgi:hypothetical protein
VVRRQAEKVGDLTKCELDGVDTADRIVLISEPHGKTLTDRSQRCGDGGDLSNGIGRTFAGPLAVLEDGLCGAVAYIISVAPIRRPRPASAYVSP